MRAYKLAVVVSLIVAVAGFLLGPVGTGFAGIGIVAAVFLCALLYVAPIVAAHARRHPQAGAITLLTLLGGWTFIGWVVAIVWANTKTVDRSDPVAHPNQSHDLRKCPECAELIRAEARKCRFCHSDITPVAAA